MIKTISPKQQMLIIEDLYNSTDSIASTRKFNDEFGKELGRIGEVTMSLNKFAKILKKAKFDWYEIDKVIQRITKTDLDVGDL